MGIGHKIRYTSKNENRGSRLQVKGVEGIFDLSFAVVVVVEIVLLSPLLMPANPFSSHVAIHHIFGLWMIATFFG
jgi:hypothetical protein